MATALRPDVVLMDINMPGMDGIAATEKLAAEVPTAAVIMMSRPGRGGLPPPVDARRGPRVPRQAVQLGRAHRLDPPGLDPGEGEARAAVAAASVAAPCRRPRRRRGASRPWSPRSSARRAASAGRPLAVNLAVAAARPARTVAPRRRLVPVRRRRRAAEPQPAQQVHRGPASGAPGGREPTRSTRSSSPTRRHPGAPCPADPGAGGARHPAGRQARRSRRSATSST